MKNLDYCKICNNRGTAKMFIYNLKKYFKVQNVRFPRDKFIFLSKRSKTDTKTVKK